jgi:regulator of protease activity HflC (stomatin/prohibitin superfamily)
VFAILWGIAVSGVRVAAEWERGVVLRLGKFMTVRSPGVMYIVPFIDNIRFVDMRLLTLNIPQQQVITKDNVPASIDSVLFYRVANAEKAVLEIQDFAFAIAQYAQATLRDIVGGLSLDELLSEREQIQNRIAELVEERIRAWGLHIDSIRLEDIEMPEELKRLMSRQASAEREKRATITKAEGDKLAAENLSAVATIMDATPGAMRLRMLRTIDGLGAGPVNTVIIFPAELTDFVKMIGESCAKEKRRNSSRRNVAVFRVSDMRGLTERYHCGDSVQSACTAGCCTPFLLVCRWIDIQQDGLSAERYHRGRRFMTRSGCSKRFRSCRSR